MCIIVAAPLNVQLQKDVLERCYKSNGDGCGFCYVKNGKVKIEKGQMSFDEFWNKVDTIQKTLPTPVLCHFRRKSVGEINDFNCHPFPIDETHAMVHNGTIWGFSSSQSKVSDTCLFNYNILQPLFKEFPTFYKMKFGRYMLEETVGSYNKIAILDAGGVITIFNESQGEWDEGCWFSNKSYLPPPPPKKSKCKHYMHQRRLKKATGYLSLVDLLDEKEGILITKNDRLTMQQISQLTHYYKKEWKQKKCKIKHLVRQAIVEPIFEKEDSKVISTV